MEKEKFCLHWNDFAENIRSAFRELCEQEDFFDLTLACEDEEIRVHKVILAACSSFFRNILQRHPHQLTLLYLKGVKYSDLQAVITFMYHGEVNVSQDQLAAFLNTAEALKIKGLADSDRDRKSEKRILEKANRSLSPSTWRRRCKSCCYQT